MRTVTDHWIKKMLCKVRIYITQMSGKLIYAKYKSTIIICWTYLNVISKFHLNLYVSYVSIVTKNYNNCRINNSVYSNGISEITDHKIKKWKSDNPRF